MSVEHRRRVFETARWGDDPMPARWGANPPPARRGAASQLAPCSGDEEALQLALALSLSTR
jgi:hypothetical protein